MKRTILGLIALAALAVAYAYEIKSASADATLSTATAIPNVTVLRVDSVTLNFLNQTATVSYSFTEAGGPEHGGGSRTIPFPHPTPGLIGNIMQAATKSLCGYPSGSMGATTPAAIATAIP